jgi:1,5-anhydro-D-fructose reductase (1,5-anhydro-D-mannitol-forming)
MALGWALVSTGKHADACIAPAIGLAEDTRFVAVYSREQERAEAFASKHGAQMAMGVHCVDVLHFILGQEVVAITAITDGQRPESPLERLATMCVQCNGGTLGTVCCGMKIPDSKNDAMLYGSHGRIVLESTLRTTLQGSLEVVSDTVNTTVSYQQDPIALYRRQIEAFNHAIQQQEAPIASGLDGLKAVQVTEAMIESAARGRLVKLAPLSV